VVPLWQGLTLPRRALDVSRRVFVSPSNPIWSGGCDFRPFFPPDQENLNNTSLVLFVGYRGFYIGLLGHLEKDGGWG
jgi:hypothetical protein